MTTYIECREIEIDERVQWSTPPQNQGQIVEVQYGDVYVGLHERGAPYRRVIDHGEGGGTSYAALAGLEARREATAERRADHARGRLVRHTTARTIDGVAVQVRVAGGGRVVVSLDGAAREYTLADLDPAHVAEDVRPTWVKIHKLAGEVLALAAETRRLGV